MSSSPLSSFSPPPSSGGSTTFVSSLSHSNSPSLTPSTSFTSPPGPPQSSYSQYLPTTSSSEDSTSVQPFPVPTPDTTTSSTTSSSTPPEPSPLSSSPTETTSQNGVSTMLAPSDATTGTPSNSGSHGFFGNRGAVAGTFTVVGLAVILIFLVVFLCRRRYQKRKQRQARKREMRTRPHLQICESLFVDDPFVCSGPMDSVVMVERQHRSEKHSVYSTTDEHTSEGMESGFATQGLTKRRFGVGDDISERTEYPADANPTPTTGYGNHGLSGPVDRHEYQQAPQLPPFDKSPVTEGPSPIIPQPEAYPPFPNWQRISQTPSSPSIYAATLSAADDHYSVHQLPGPSSVAYPDPIPVPNPSYQSGATSRRHSSLRRVKPEAHTAPLGLEDDY